MPSTVFMCFTIILVVSSGLVQSLQRRSEESGRNSTGCFHCSAPKVTSLLENQTEIVGKKLILKCYTKGHPSPNVTWYKDGKVIDSATKGRVVTKSIDRGSRLKIKILHQEDSGQYYCNVSNKVGYAVSNVATILVKGLDWNKTLNIGPTSSYKDEFNYHITPHPGYCVHYTGQKCSAYINRQKSIHIKPFNTQSSVEKKLQIAFDSISKSNKLGDKCKPYVLPVLCHYLFPYCDDLSNDPKPRKLCHEECKVLRDDICMEEYKVVKRELLLVLFPDCALLPSKDSKEGKNCIPLPLVFARPVRYKEEKGDQCYNGTGRYYRGNVSITESGYSCQRWNSTEPHYHLMSPAVFHELRGGHNFCRNPGGKKDRPWCFTTNEKKRYDYCSIARCKEEPPPIHVVSILYTVIPCLLIGVIFSSIVIFICWRCHKQIIYQSSNQSSTPLMPVAVKTTDKIQELKESLRLLKDVGEGEFGKFYHCEISTRTDDGAVVVNQVFVSSLRKYHNEYLRSEFLQDKEVWAKFTHPNVLPIVAICNQGTPTYVLYEFLECGTLHEYLLRHAMIEDSGDDSKEDSLTLWTYDLLSIGYQIAAGMNYLSSSNYVHGDLATRNCMIGARFDVKITDFAATRVGYAHDYYRLPNRRPLPVRWMAPESINSYRFTTESDIWSFGVILWELFSYGAQPYYGLTNEQVIHSFRDYVMLMCPIDCPSSVYTLMTECWDILPPSRPTFSSIYKKLCALRCDNSTPVPT